MERQKRKTWNYKMMVCSYCKKPFIGSPWARFCSPACKQAAYRERQKTLRHSVTERTVDDEKEQMQGKNGD